MATAHTHKQPGAEPCPYCGGVYSRCYGAIKRHRKACAPKTYEALDERAKALGWQTLEVPNSVWVFDARGNVLVSVGREEPWPYARALRLARKATATES